MVAGAGATMTCVSGAPGLVPFALISRAWWMGRSKGRGAGRSGAVGLGISYYLALL